MPASIEFHTHMLRKKSGGSGRIDEILTKLGGHIHDQEPGNDLMDDLLLWSPDGESFTVYIKGGSDEQQRNWSCAVALGYMQLDHSDGLMVSRELDHANEVLVMQNDRAEEFARSLLMPVLDVAKLWENGARKAIDYSEHFAIPEDQVSKRLAALPFVNIRELVEDCEFQIG